MDNTVGIDCGSRWWEGQRRAKWGKWDICNRITTQKMIYKKNWIVVKRNECQDQNNPRQFKNYQESRITSLLGEESGHKSTKKRKWKSIYRALV